MKLNAKAGVTSHRNCRHHCLCQVRLSPQPFLAEQGKCFGVNGCKGKVRARASRTHCKGHNACKGQGFLVMSECARKGGNFQG